MSDADANKIHLLPEGRLINHSLFAKDQYNDKATPAYKVEVAYDPGVLDPFFEELLKAAVDEWGEGADAADAALIIPIKDGDEMADKREENSKAGDAYRGKRIIRAKTIFNKYGNDADGGVAVYDLDVTEITILNADKIYPGCMVEIAVTIGAYQDRNGGKETNALTLYLTAVQKSADGERLGGDGDQSSLFTKKADTQAAEDAAPGRRTA